ncbi:Hypothetical predicted protein [Paramuricea clavata]|uniref:Uncharacterized protein n=1 Tax=Paramuricea clavata TaxID=317549 RepID=A0A6S7GE13_PARCT|nr:Hypothetical predicted protein [Paramuricea clavata]
MAVNIELSGIQLFDSTGDSTSVSPRWKRWRKSFQFFVEAKGIEEGKQKKALLHCAGVDAQEIFEALDNSKAGGPVAQSPRRIPFGLRKKVEDKLTELLDTDIIEKAEAPTPWVSPVCIVPKPSGEIRLCVDMRRANEAIQREKHPIPTMAEVLLDMNQSTGVSIKLNWKKTLEQ